MALRPSPRPLRPPPRPLGPALEKISIPPGSPYSKELRLLQHVFRNAKRGDPASVCASIEQFGQGVLGQRGQWLKVAGGGKAGLLKAAVSGAPPGGQILEIGAYCGFSASKMAMAVPGVHIASLEVDPVHVVIARNVIHFGGLADDIDVWTGHSKDLIPRISGRYGGPENLFYSAVFMDQKGSRYDEDLTALEKLGLLWPGAVVIADNVLKPGAPIYLWHVVVEGDYKAQCVSMKEFAMPSEDWMSVSVRRLEAEVRARAEAAERAAAEEAAKAAEAAAKAAAPPDEAAEAEEPADVPDWKPAPPYQPPNVPPDLTQLNRETDRMRERATGPGRSVTFQEWAKFAENVKARLAASGIVQTAEAPDPK